MADERLDSIVRVLEEIRDGQKLQLERQAQALARQAEIAARRSELSSKTDKLMDEAAALQNSAAAFHQESVRLLRQTRFMSLLGIPFALALLLIACWLVFYRIAA